MTINYDKHGYYNMIKKITFVSLIFFLGSTLSAQQVQKGPYTVKTLADSVYDIEDANDSNPAGMVTGDNGKVVHMNNCSDMYLILGSRKALLIDLSNEIKWDGTAKESLRSIVFDLIKDRDLFIAITHKHADHLGMLPAFKDDPTVKFWIPEDEFKGMDIFPKERTDFFPKNASLDLGGGTIIDSMELPGHTEHSTIYFLRNKNMIFTGDAIGSGSGVWLFNKESFYTYITSVEKLIKYIKDPAHHINLKKLVIYGGHGWQRGKQEKLTVQYLYDMESLIERMELGIAETEKMPAIIPFMNTNFRFGTAAISWNKEAASEFAAATQKGMGTFTRISRHQDYGLTVTRLVVDLGEGSMVSGKDLTKGTFEVIGINKSNKVIRNITGLSVTDKEGNTIEEGSHVTIDLDFGFDSDTSNAYTYIVILNKDLGMYKKGKRFIQHGRILRK